AAPERESVVGSTAGVAAALGGLTLVAALSWGLGARAPALLSTLGAGAAFAGTGVTSKLVSDGLATGDWLLVIGIGALTAALATVGVADEMAALQRQAATRAVPAILVVQVVAPVLLAPVVAGEHWSSSPLDGLSVVP